MPEETDSGSSDQHPAGKPPARPHTGAAFAGESTGSFSELPVGDSSSDETVIAPAGSGNEIIGDYEILGKLGQGGMGAVYRARQISLHRQVALKILPANLEADDEFVARFQREARTAASLNHENIVKVYASGFVDGCHYIAMELIEGETLGQFLKRSGALEPADALRVTRDVALALQCGWNKAHLIHRDIKPGNIFLSEEGEVKVGDLGLARSMANDTTGLTQTGTAMGTPNYISPEQAKGERDLDFRADIYSLGCTLFQMLTGRTPYTGADPMSVMHQHIHGPPPAILKLLPQCPIPLARLVGKMLKKIKRERQASYEELLAEIEKVQTLYAPAEDATLSAILPPDPDATMLQAPGSASTQARVPTAPTIVLAKPKSKLSLYGTMVGAVILAGVAAVVLRPKPSAEKLSKVQLAMQQRESEEAARGSQPAAMAAPAKVDALGETLPAAGWKPVETRGVRMEGHTIMETLPDGWLRMQNTPYFGPRRRDIALRARLRFTGGEVWALKVRSRMTSIGGDNYNAGISSDGTAVQLLRRDYISGGGFNKGDATIATAPLPRKLEKGEEYQLAFAALGEDLAIYVNGQRLIHTRDTFCPGDLTNFGGGTVGEYKDLEWIPLNLPGSTPTQDIAGLPSWKATVFANLSPDEATQHRNNVRMEGDFLHITSVAGWIQPGVKARNMILRATILWKSGKSDAKIRARLLGDRLNYDDGVWAWISQKNTRIGITRAEKEESPFKNFDFPAPLVDGSEITFELATIGHRAFVVLNGQLLGEVENPGTDQAGQIAIQAVDIHLKKLEYVDLDTTPEDVASEKYRASLASSAGATPPAPTASAGPTFTNGLGMKFVPVPIVSGPTAGERVLFSIWETRAQDYQTFVADTKRSWSEARIATTPAHPALRITWENASAFCAWLTEREHKSGKISARQTYRLPSDHEWSCAAGIGEREDPARSPASKDNALANTFVWGSQWPPPPGVGNFRSAVPADQVNDMAPVGKFSPSATGLYDLVGNAWEWCEDRFAPPADERVLRGGSSMDSDASYFLASHRIGRGPTYSSDTTGFRVVLAGDSEAGSSTAPISLTGANPSNATGSSFDAAKSRAAAELAVKLGAQINFELEGKRETRRAVPAGAFKLLSIVLPNTEETARVQPADVQVFAKVRELENLNLFSAKQALDEETCRQISSLTNLKFLGFQSTNLDDAGLRYFSSLPALEGLSAAGTRITDEGFTSFDRQTSLRGLDVTGTNVTEIGLQRLGALSKLKRLSVGSASRALDDEVQTIIRGADALEFLFLNGPVKAESLQGVGHLKELQKLQTSKWAWTGAHFEQLAALPNLNTLIIEGDTIGADAWEQLPKLRQLTTLVLKKMAAPPELELALKRFTKAPTVQVDPEYK